MFLRMPCRSGHAVLCTDTSIDYCPQFCATAPAFFQQCYVSSIYSLNCAARPGICCSLLLFTCTLISAAISQVRPSNPCLPCMDLAIQCWDTHLLQICVTAGGTDGCGLHVQAGRATSYYVAPSGPPAMPSYAAAAPQYASSVLSPGSKAPQSAEDALASVKVGH